MATLLLAAVGSALGGSIGGTVLGLSGAVIGKAVGATLGSLIDQKLIGSASDPVETGRLTAFRVQNSTEGAAIPRLAGAMRVAGQVIWSTRFKESVRTSGGAGKGGAPGPATREFSYSLSFAIGLCAGPVVRIGRVWADGTLFPVERVVYRLHRGDEVQGPDPLIEAVEGTGNAPSYRGLAYLVFEDLPVGEFGNRIPQFNIEVFRQPVVPAELVPEAALRPSALVRGVSLVPGTGEYVLAPDALSYTIAKGVLQPANVHNASGETDLRVSLAQLGAELPVCDAVALVVSWFGNDLRCGLGRIEPAVDQKSAEVAAMPWAVSGRTRATAKLVGMEAGRPVYGGTPTDQSVVAAIREIKAGGRRVMFYPFILMDIAAANGLADPWTGAADQAAYPWRGRITLGVAPGQAGSPDKSAAAAAEVAAFMGGALPGHFVPGADTVGFTGGEDWGFRRFVLHYAHLCAVAGGVDAFCIGSEMRGLTQIRDSATGYPAVAALRALAADVRAVLGAGTKIGYAADWSEYSGHRPQDASGDVLFHLDPLWADANVDFVGIDNYMPLSDWRDGAGHLDAVAGSIYDIGYLKGNVAGGEGFDWYYASQGDRDAQVRTPIVDTAHGEHWVFRYKDIRAWWSSLHHDRPGGVRAAGPTAWVPQSKPVWFTEIGCPAVDKGTNQPNVFVDPKSSESALPHFSSGQRDDFIQLRFVQAVHSYWADAANNPVSALYGGPMVDPANTYVWAWDARPWPDFPARVDAWADGANYELGHWIPGRLGSATLPEVVAELCLEAGVGKIDVSGLSGTVRGHALDGLASARQALQPLMLAYGFDSVERDGRIVFRMRGGRVDHDLAQQSLALAPEDRSGTGLVLRRAPSAEMAEAVRVHFVDADNDYQLAAVEAQHPTAPLARAEEGRVPLAMSAGEARRIAERWLAEVRVSRDQAEFGLPPSLLRVEPGDTVRLPGGRAGAVYRVERIEEAGARLVEVRRVEEGVFRGAATLPRQPPVPPVPPSTEVFAQFLDLPLLRGDEVEHAPWIAVGAAPWPGRVAVWGSAALDGFVLNRLVDAGSLVGTTLDPLPALRPWLWSRGASLHVRLNAAGVLSRTELDVLNGANAMALRAPGAADWEIVQFRNAVLVAAGTWRLSGFLRGQAGTEFLAGLVVPAGADVVLLDRGPVQIDLLLSELGLPRTWRVGLAALPVSDASFVHTTETFAGVGLRPWAPVRLRAARNTTGAVVMSWVRRTRKGGDGWSGPDVPLSEESERYEVGIVAGGLLRRAIPTLGPATTYTSADQLADGVTAPFDIEVAQISGLYGAGTKARMTFDD